MSTDPKPSYRIQLKTFAVVKCADAPAPQGKPIVAPAQAVDYLLPFFKAADCGREHFAIMLLDSRHRALAGRIMFSGTLNEAAIYPREIARVALLIGAASCICAHNHPSGNTAPSLNDIGMTRKIKEILNMIEVRLLDSLVISVEDGQFHSMRESRDVVFHESKLP